MTSAYGNLVQETTTTAGTGNIDLNGAMTGYAPFEDYVSNGVYTAYCLKDGDEREVGIGRFSATPNTLSRDTVLWSTNGNAKINLSGSGVVVTNDIPVSKRPTLDENGKLFNGGTNIQAIANLVLAANKLIYATGPDAVAMTDLSAFARTYLDDADGPTMLATIGAVAKDGTIAMTGGLTLSGDPSTNLQAATKQYVDAAVAGLPAKRPVLLASTANLTLLGEQTIDGITTLASRILVKNQAAPAQNGIYLTGVGAWTRTTDADSWAELVGALIDVESGTANANTLWECTSDDGGTLGTTAVTIVEFFGGALSASLVSYSNSTSGLVSTTAQGAIDELASRAGSYTIAVDTLALLRTAAVPANHATALMKGYTAAYDGGGGPWQYETALTGCYGPPAISAAGSGYLDGFYRAVGVTGGDGTGATVDVWVEGGVVVAVQRHPGSDGTGYSTAWTNIVWSAITGNPTGTPGTIAGALDDSGCIVGITSSQGSGKWVRIDAELFAPTHRSNTVLAEHYGVLPDPSGASSTDYSAALVRAINAAAGRLVLLKTGTITIGASGSANSSEITAAVTAAYIRLKGAQDVSDDTHDLSVLTGPAGLPSSEGSSYNEDLGARIGGKYTVIKCVNGGFIGGHLLITDKVKYLGGLVIYGHGANSNNRVAVHITPSGAVIERCYFALWRDGGLWIRGGVTSLIDRCSFFDCAYSKAQTGSFPTTSGLPTVVAVPDYETGAAFAMMSNTTPSDMHTVNGGARPTTIHVSNMYISARNHNLIKTGANISGLRGMYLFGLQGCDFTNVGSYMGCAMYLCSETTFTQWRVENYAQNGVAAYSAGTSTTSNVIGTGSKTWTISSSGLTYALGDAVVVTDAGNAANTMTGYVTSYTGTTIVINVVIKTGSGTITSWTFAQAPLCVRARDCGVTINEPTFVNFAGSLGMFDDGDESFQHHILTHSEGLVTVASLHGVTTGMSFYNKSMVNGAGAVINLGSNSYNSTLLNSAQIIYWGSNLTPFQLGKPDQMVLYNPSPGGFQILADNVSASIVFGVRVSSTPTAIRTITNTTETSIAQQLGQDGTASLPGYSFSADPDTGLYRIGANNPGMSAGTSLVHSWAALGNTQPLQPCFQAQLVTTVLNQTGDGTIYHVIFDTKNFDVGSNFNLGTSVFTAPVTGKYLITALLTATGFTSNANMAGQLITTGKTFNAYGVVTGYGTSSIGTVPMSVVTAMTAGDTAYCTIKVDGGAKVVDIGDSWFTAVLVC